MTLLERIGVDTPIIQAGLGGGLSGHELAAAVSEAGGLGTIAAMGGATIERELSAVRRLTAKPIAVNLLLPFADRSSRRAAMAADVVVTFWGRPVRPTPRVWLHQVGCVAEARMARAAGADGLIVQGLEAGGHVRGCQPALSLLTALRSLMPKTTLFLAGGVVERRDVRLALDAGAQGVVVGTRFLMTCESRAHTRYKDLLCATNATILTDLFGFGWPARHRVLATRSVADVLNSDGSVPRSIQAANRLSGRVPVALRTRLQTLAIRSPALAWSPQPMTASDPADALDARPLYAGTAVARITTLEPAASLVPALTP